MKKKIYIELVNNYIDQMIKSGYNKHTISIYQRFILTMYGMDNLDKKTCKNIKYELRQQYKNYKKWLGGE